MSGSPIDQDSKKRVLRGALLTFISLLISSFPAWAAPGEQLDNPPGEPPVGDDLEEDDALIVTGTRTPQRRGESPVATEVITRGDIENSGATDVAQVMRSMAAVQIDEGFAGPGISLQGLNAKHTLILVDGERVLGLKDGIVDLRRFNTENIERIEIVRGAGSALYGADALGGVVNIITRGVPKEAILAQGKVMTGDDQSVELTARTGGRLGAWSGSLVSGFHHLPSFKLDEDETEPDATDGNAIDDWYVQSQTR